MGVQSPQYKRYPPMIRPYRGCRLSSTEGIKLGIVNKINPMTLRIVSCNIVTQGLNTSALSRDYGRANTR